MTNPKKRRAAIYAMYDKDGHVDAYIVYALQQLKKVVDFLVVVSNSFLCDMEKDKLNMADVVFERNDEGFDAGAISAVLLDFVGIDTFAQFDELVIMNDSVFGPFYPLEEMFAEMDERKELDFWGITERGVSNFDGGLTMYPKHIQLYFYVVRNSLMKTECFALFWKRLQGRLTDFRSAIIHYEFTFTEYFEMQGFRSDVYIKTPEYDTADIDCNLSPYHYSTYEMVKKGCPVLKRKLCTGDFIELSYSDRSDLCKTISYLYENDLYDINLIWAHILRVYPLDEIIDGMHLNCVMQEKKTNHCKTNDVRVEVLNFDKKDSILSDMEEKGVRLAPFCQDGMSGLVFVIKRKKQEVKNAAIEKSKKSIIVDNLVYNSDYVNNVVVKFIENPHLGILIPPIDTYGDIVHQFESQWGDENYAEILYSKLNLHVCRKKKKAPVHRIEAIWCRKEILDSIIIECLEKDETQTVFQMMTLYAQEKGYYTEVIQSEKYVAYEYNNMRRLLQNIFKAVPLKRDADERHLIDDIKRKEIELFCSRNKEIYIYGAGQLACRAAVMIESTHSFNGFIVTDKNSNPDKLMGYKVYSLREVDIKKKGIIVAVGEKNEEVVIENIRKQGVEDYIVY